jgi:hypothetical protein
MQYSGARFVDIYGELGMLLTAITTRKRSRILWLAERSRPYFLLHPDHLPIFLSPPLQTQARRGFPWMNALAAWLRSCAAAKDPTFRVGILDELLFKREFLELQRYLQCRRWDLQALKTWKPVDFRRAPAALASWDLAGILLELSATADYDLSFKAVGCVEPLAHPDLPRDCKGQELMDYLLAD